MMATPQLDFDPWVDRPAQPRGSGARAAAKPAVIDFDPYTDGPAADDAPDVGNAQSKVTGTGAAPGFGKTFSAAIARGGASAMASTAHTVADFIDQTVQEPIRRVTGPLFGKDTPAVAAFADPLGARAAAGKNLAVEKVINADRQAVSERIGHRPTMAEWKDAPGDAAKRTALRLTNAAGESIPLLAAAVATRNPELGAGLMGGVTGAQEYAYLRGEGVGRGQAARAAALTGAVEAAGEGVGLPVVMGKAGRGSILRAAMAEGAQEAPVQVAQQNIEDQATGRQTSVGEQLLDALDAAVVGGALGAGAHVAGARHDGRSGEVPRGIGRPLGGPIMDVPIDSYTPGPTGAAASMRAQSAEMRANAQGPLSRVGADALDQQAGMLEAQSAELLAPEVASEVASEVSTGNLKKTRARASQGEPGAMGRGHPSSEGLALQGSPGSERSLAGMPSADNAGSMTRQSAPDNLQVPAGRIGSPELDFDPSLSPVRTVAREAATSPENDLPTPTPAQLDAGNFRVGRIRINGLDISIEHPAGVKRKAEHSQPLAHAYGYIRGTQGGDGEKFDVFLGEHADDTTRPVFVIDQKKVDGSFDESKAMLGFDTLAQARAAYLANYPKGWEQKGLGGIREMTQDEFKAWVTDPKAARKPAQKPVALDFDPHLEAPPGPGMRREHAERLVRRYTKGLPNHPQVVLVDDADDLHRAAGVQAGNDGARAEGLFNGKPAVFLNLGAIGNPKRFRQVLAHEALGHHGVEQVVGDAWPGIARAIAGHIEHGTGAPWMRKAIVRARASQPGVVDPQQLAREVVAVMAEQGSRNRLVGTVIARTRGTLRQAIPSVKWTEHDIRDLLSQGESYLRRQPGHPKAAVAGSPAAQGPGTGGVLFSKPGEAPPDTAHVAQQFGHVTDPQRAALGKISTFQRPEPLRDRAARLSVNLRAKAIQGTVDQFHAFKDLDERAYMQARLSKGTDGAVEGVFRYGLPKLTDGALDIQPDGKGFLGHLQALQGEHDLFLAWVAGHRSEQLAADDREHLFTPDDIAALKNLNKGRMADGRSREAVYRKALQVLNRYQSAVLDIAQEAGEVNAPSRARWQTDFYLPYFRDMSASPPPAPHPSRGGDGPADIAEMRKQVIERLVGGGQPLNDLLENTLQNWGRLLSASMKNLAATRALEAAVEIGVAKPVQAAERGTVSAMFKGERKHFQVDDPLVLESLVMLYTPPWSNPAMKGLQWFKRALTFGVTINPSFRIRNLMRDTLSTLSSNRIGYNPLRNLVQGWKATEKGSDTYLKLLGGGGAIRFGSLLDGDQARHAKRLIQSGIASDAQILDAPAKVRAALGKAWDAYQEFGDRAETVNRAALYEQARAGGKDHLEASFAARDTLDFTNTGAWPAVQFLARVVPFMNARLQGLYKLGRGAKQDPRRFAAVTGAVAMASVLLHLLNADDEDYRALPDWVRDSYWWVRLPGTEYALYIPKPFEVGALASVAERSTELMTAGDDYQAKDFAQTLLSILSQQLAMNPIPQAVRPGMEAAFNYDTFQDRSIDSMGQERLPAEDRYNARTSGGAVALGKATGVSPRRIEHLVRGYFGWLGMQALNVSDLLTRDLLDLGSTPAHDFGKVDNLAVIGSFIRERDTGSSKYVQRFYEQRRQVDMLYAAYAAARQAGDLERAQELAGDDRLKLRGLYLAANREMTKVNRRIRQVTNDRQISAAAKYELLVGLYGTRARLAERTTGLARERGRGRR